MSTPAKSRPDDSSSIAAQASSRPMKSSLTAARRTKQILHQLAHHQTTTTTAPIASTSTRQMPASASPAAPWRSAFLAHVEEMESPSFSLSTLHDAGAAAHAAHHTSPPNHSTITDQRRQQLYSCSYVPRVRTVIFRGMWASLPVNPKNPAELNPDTYDSDMPTITTDVRMEKVPQVLGDGGTSSSSSSAVGGPFEAVFWATQSQTQWRLRGFACIIGPDIESNDAAPVRAALQARMRRQTGEDKEEEATPPASWSWSRELTAHFGNLSPMMRGSFRNPPPGTPIAEKPQEGLGLGLGQTVQDVEDEVARRNFRVMVLVPQKVERLDLSDPKSGRRWMHSLDSSGAWQTTELWP